MKPMSTDDLDLLERIAVAETRQKRKRYLRVLDDLLAAFDDAGEVSSLDEIRAMFAAYEKPGMATLSSEIEAMREAR